MPPKRPRSHRPLAIRNGWVMTVGTGGQPAAVAPDPGTVPAGRRAARASTVMWAALVLAAFTGAALAVVARGGLKASDLLSNLGTAVAVVAYATLGTLTVRRAGNLIGWLMLSESAGLAFVTLASTYAVLGVAVFPGALPAAKQAGAVAEVSFTGVAFLLAFMVLLFPTGKLPSRRWRPLAAAGFLLAGLSAAGLVLRPRLVQLPVPGGTSLIFPNPFGLAHFPQLLREVPIGTLDELFVASVAFEAAAFVSLAVRYRAGGRLLRLQVKWLVLVVVAFVVCQLISLLLIPLGQPWLSGIARTAVAIIVLFGIPAAMTIAILRHRLFDIDVIISRAVVYGLLSAAFTVVYAGIVLGIGAVAGHRGGPLLTVAAAVCIAVLFQPLRHRFQQFANRLVYGERATPYQVLADFAEDMAGQLDFTEAVDRMVSVLAGATGADRAEAWIRVGPQLHPAAVWPRNSVPPSPEGRWVPSPPAITCRACPSGAKRGLSPASSTAGLPESRSSRASQGGAQGRRREQRRAPQRPAPQRLTPRQRVRPPRQEQERERAQGAQLQPGSLRRP
jgi:hypothetical protein